LSVRPRVRDHLLNNSRSAPHHVFDEQPGQLRSPLSEHWRGTTAACAASGRLRPPRTLSHRSFIARSIPPLMLFREVPFGDSHVRLGAARACRFSRSAASLPSWLASLPVAPRFAGAPAAGKLSTVDGQPNLALVRTGRQHRASRTTVLDRRTARR